MVLVPLKVVDMSCLVESCRMHFFTIICESPQAHLHSVGMLQFMSDINHLSLPTPLYSVLASTILPTTLLFLTLFFRSYLRLIGPFNFISLYESLLQP